MTDDRIMYNTHSTHGLDGHFGRSFYIVGHSSGTLFGYPLVVLDVD